MLSAGRWPRKLSESIQLNANKSTHLHQFQKRSCEFLKDMIDFGEQVVGTEKRSPTFENRMGHLKNTVVDLCIIGGEFRHKILI